MTPKNERAKATGRGVVLAERYRLEERVAGGGMGEVWRATDTLLQRSVAVKLLRESLAEDSVVSERFRREALLTAQVSHPNMAGVFDYVQEDGRPGIVMEFVDGETLADRLAREGKIEVADAVRITSAVLAALQAAHDAGIVHRDVKPGNVMLTVSGDVKVTDFGIARAASDHTLTETGMVIGTAHYLAPEQVSGKPATPASDIYSVGAILYEMLAGARPFEGETPIAIAMRRIAEDPRPLRDAAPEVPEPVSAVVMRALSRDPAKRHESAADMRRAFETAYAWGQPSTQPQRIGPTPTQVLELPVSDEAAATVAMHPQEPQPAPGSAPPAAVSRRRLREYRRLIVWGLLLALVAGLVTLGVLALTGGGTEIVNVPNFRGRTIQQARAQAQELGLSLTEVPRDSTLPAGSVTGQSIPAGTPVAEGAGISVGVSTGRAPTPPGVRVPDVVGMDKDDAERVLKDAGFTVKVTEEETSRFDAGTVFGQDPSPPDTAQPGSEVVIVVAKEPQRGKGRDRGGGDD